MNINWVNLTQKLMKLWKDFWISNVTKVTACKSKLEWAIKGFLLTPAKFVKCQWQYKMVVMPAKHSEDVNNATMTSVTIAWWLKRRKYTTTTMFNNHKMLHMWFHKSLLQNYHMKPKKRRLQINNLHSSLLRKRVGNYQT